MSVKVIEVTHSRSLVSSDNPSGEVHYMVTGASDPEVVELNVLATAPGVYAGLIRDTITITPHPGDSTSWEVVVSYRKAKRLRIPGTGEELISFDIEPRTVHITHSKQTIRTYPGSGAPGFGRGMGFRKGEFQGAEKFVPQLSFSITKYVPAAYVNNALIATFREAAFHTNDELWRGQPPESCMFMGVSGSRRNEDDYALTFQFLSVEPETGLTFGSIAGVEKGSWEHLWVLTEPSEDAAAQDYVVELPRAVYIERIYDPINFPTYLGLTA